MTEDNGLTIDLLQKWILTNSYPVTHHRLTQELLAAMQREADMGRDKAVKNGTGQEQSGIASEAAGLEPECSQPLPTNTSEIPVIDEDDLYELISEAIPTSVKYEARNESIKGVADAIRPYLRTSKPVMSGCVEEGCPPITGTGKLSSASLRMAAVSPRFPNSRLSVVQNLNGGSATNLCIALPLMQMLLTLLFMERGKLMFLISGKKASKQEYPVCRCEYPADENNC